MKLDYEQGTLSIRQCHEQKLAYQKFYISIVSAILIIIIYVDRSLLKGEESIAGNVINGDYLIGTSFIFAALIGAIVVKNLAHIRINVVFYNNAVVNIRQFFISNLKLNNYPAIKPSSSSDRKSADYITIVLCSFINLILFGLGVFAISKEFESNIIQIIFYIMALVIYIAFHIYGIEKILNEGIDPKLNKNRK